MRKWFLALVLAAALLGAGCGQMGQKDTAPQTVSRPAVQSAERQFAALTGGETVAVFDTSAGVFKAVLYPDLAPQACDNFIGLVNKGFYNGLTITRVEKDFVVSAGQGADGKGTTIWGGSRYPAEYTDSLHHYSGALCAAADASGDCASVFYVVQTPPDAVSPGTDGSDDRRRVSAGGDRRLSGGRRCAVSGLWGHRVWPDLRGDGGRGSDRTVRSG